MEPIVLKVLEIAQASPSEGGAAFARTPAIAPVPPDDLASRQFTELMEGANPVQEAPRATQRTEALTGQRSLGDAILTGLTQLTTGVQQAWAGVHTGIAPGIERLSVSEILAKQVQVMEFTLQYQTIGHGLSKANQDLNELIKLQ